MRNRTVLAFFPPHSILPRWRYARTNEKSAREQFLNGRKPEDEGGTREANSGCGEWVIVWEEDAPKPQENEWGIISL